MSIRHVVLPDLHLGARDSLMTHIQGSGEIAEGPSEVLAAFANGMRETLKGQPMAQTCSTAKPSKSQATMIITCGELRRIMASSQRLRTGKFPVTCNR